MPAEDRSLGRIGAYRMVRRLATGGTSDVLVAKAEGPHGFERTVVLKRLLSEHRSDPEFSRMFVREAAAYARLSHPAIVKLHDFFEHEGQLVMVLEYVDGVSLSRLLNQRAQTGRPLGDAAALWTAARIFDALAAAHAAREPDSGEFSPVVHRDVNPANVLCPWDGHVKLTDFGIAKVAGFDAETKTGVLKGTYGYMAPEQVRGERVTIRADVYCGALVLWELLAHRRAFPSERRPEMELLRAMAEPQLPSLDQLRPDLPPALREAISRALHPVADRRRITAEEMVGVLRAATSMEGGRLALVDALRPLRPASQDPLAVTSAEDVSELDLDDHTLEEASHTQREPPRSTVPTAEVAYVRPSTLPFGTPPPGRAGAETMPRAAHALADVASRSSFPPRTAALPRPPPALSTRTQRGLGAHSGAPLAPPQAARAEAASIPEELVDTQVRSPETLPPSPAAASRAEPGLPYAPSPATAKPSPTPSWPPPGGHGAPPVPPRGSAPPPGQGSPGGAAAPPREAPAVVLQAPQRSVRPMAPPYQPLPVRPIRAGGGGLLAIVLAVVAVFLLAGGGALGYWWLRTRGEAASAPSPPAPAATPKPTATATVSSVSASVGASGSGSPAATAVPALSTAPAATAPASAAPGSPPVAISDKEGVLRMPARAAGHRVYVDGKVAGHGVDPITVACGRHMVKVGSGDTERTVEVPCGGSVSIP
jgi:serine/threonine-protein kinase